MEVIGRAKQDARAENESGRLQGSNRVDSREGIGRVESGTETEKMSGSAKPARRGTNFPDRVEEWKLNPLKED